MSINRRAGSRRQFETVKNEDEIVRTSLNLKKKNDSNYTSTFYGGGMIHGSIRAEIPKLTSASINRNIVTSKKSPSNDTSLNSIHKKSIARAINENGSNMKFIHKNRILSAKVPRDQKHAEPKIT